MDWLGASWVCLRRLEIRAPPSKIAMSSISPLSAPVVAGQELEAELGALQKEGVTLRCELEEVEAQSGQESAEVCDAAEWHDVTSVFYLAGYAAAGAREKQ